MVALPTPPQPSISESRFFNEPNLKDVLDVFEKGLKISFNCHAIGTVQSFNKLDQTAVVTINYKRTFQVLNPVTQQYDVKLEDYPLIMDAPCIFPGGGDGALTMPVDGGDECVVLFNDRDLDKWFSGNSNSGVNTQRLHSFADGIILVGIRSLNTILLNFDPDRVVLRNGLLSRVAVSESAAALEYGPSPGDTIPGMPLTVVQATSALAQLATNTPGLKGEVTVDLLTGLITIKTTLGSTLGAALATLFSSEVAAMTALATASTAVATAAALGVTACTPTGTPISPLLATFQGIVTAATAQATAATNAATAFTNASTAVGKILT